MCSYSKRNARKTKNGQYHLALTTRKKQEKAPALNVSVESRSALTAPFSKRDKFTQAQRPAAARPM